MRTIVCGTKHVGSQGVWAIVQDEEGKFSMQNLKGQSKLVSVFPPQMTLIPPLTEPQLVELVAHKFKSSLETIVNQREPAAGKRDRKNVTKCLLFPQNI